VPDDAGEAGGRGVEGLAGDRCGLVPVHPHDQPGQHPAVGQVDPGRTGSGELPGAVREDQPRRGDGGHQLMQIGLLVPD
jgi:hypothetical protein